MKIHPQILKQDVYKRQVSKAFQEAVEKTVNERLAGGKPPKKAETKTIYTLDQIKNMSADEINKNWEAVQEAMKASK